MNLILDLSIKEILKKSWFYPTCQSLFIEICANFVRDGARLGWITVFNPLGLNFDPILILFCQSYLSMPRNIISKNCNYLLILTWYTNFWPLTKVCIKTWRPEFWPNFRNILPITFNYAQKHHIKNLKLLFDFNLIYQSLAIDWRMNFNFGGPNFDPIFIKFCQSPLTMPRNIISKI